ncbi:MAG: hypothetical protein LAO31_17595 [Acidobacteriia bacterium]|nr:hypothetical protein [Terriglobia bacterium]
MNDLLKRVKSSIADALANELITKLLKWVLSVAVFSSPSAILWRRKGLRFFTSVHLVQGWIIAVCLGVILLALFILVKGIVTRYRKHKRKLRYFSWRGLKWPLTEPFFQNYNHLNATAILRGFIDQMILTPICPNCERDVQIGEFDAFEDKNSCPHCQQSFELKFAEPFLREAVDLGTLKVLKKEVYIEAQASARKGKIH